MKSNDIIIVGDLHCDWASLNRLINRKHPKYILQVGDFGWWPTFHNIPKSKTVRNKYGKWIKPYNNLGIKCQDTEIYFCPGNHECWEELLLNTSVPTHLYSNVYYMKRGATLTLPDGRIVLFMGGAISIDKSSRTQGVDWFPQELIPYSEFYKLKESGIDKVDIVISHTCPTEFNQFLRVKRVYKEWENKFKDSSQQVLSAILEEYKPKLWYFGHFHVSMKGTHQQTKWYCLNYPHNGGRWWRYLSSDNERGESCQHH